MTINTRFKEMFITWKAPAFISKLFFSFGFFTFSLVINYYAVRHATSNAGEPIGDLILNILPKIDTTFIHEKLASILQTLTALILVCNPKLINFTLRAVGVLVLTRAVFINLTFLGLPQGSIPLQSFYTYGGDLFFSGHVALAFMIALIFWNIPKIKYLYLIISLGMGIEVLLGHYHYSIDVFAAPFITYGIFMLSKKLFREDVYALEENNRELR